MITFVFMAASSSLFTRNGDGRSPPVHNKNLAQQRIPQCPRRNGHQCAADRSPEKYRPHAEDHDRPHIGHGVAMQILIG
jgi:hypothetical protein